MLELGQMANGDGFDNSDAPKTDPKIVLKYEGRIKAIEAELERFQEILVGDGSQDLGLATWTLLVPRLKRVEEELKQLKESLKELLEP